MYHHCECGAEIQSFWNFCDQCGKKQKPTTMWKTVTIEGSQGKQIAYVPGLAQATAPTAELAFEALVKQLGASVVGVDYTTRRVQLRR